jgi:hypothetical protein
VKNQLTDPDARAKPGKLDRYHVSLFATKGDDAGIPRNDASASPRQ